ncbi:MAG: XdhC family protein [Parvibaculum sp.]|uniref:XdhC family protein n=1 Tax=Parvibaculum sp. TaxID=2024848 RepID=UPI001E095500|nr:XdhC family protein [Parvibaculum sp.]MBX3488048.1 XdhC family protein [Parvibaculum sp.]MBX3495850.1 XdhC family protein [Parvibaculum sp.]MCW5727973.1 XdhC family protein [Parvibaculum sp.]
MNGQNISDDNVLEDAANWRAQGRKVALATVIETWGSAPRPTGSQLAIRDDGSFVGSVSGGCIEGDVVTRALETLTSGKPEILEYGVSDAMAWEVGLACGGRIRVMVEPVTG